MSGISRQDALHTDALAIPEPGVEAVISQDRRSFLKATGAVVSAAAVGACGPEASAPEASGTRDALDAGLLAAVGEVVLPAEMSAPDRAAAVAAFRRWTEAYEAVAELNHGYGTAEIRYGPADPVPGWNAQLQALDVEARKRHGRGFSELDAEGRTALLRRHVRDRGPDMPAPLAAAHVGVALLSHWLASPDATDRCYGVRITPLTCRGLDRTREIPEVLEPAEAEG